MPKGLASEETRKLILGATSTDSPVIPDSFYCGDALASKGPACCFWHYIFYPERGPERDGLFHPVYAYEIEILAALKRKSPTDSKEHKKDKHVCVYKATGLGLTELVLLWTLWKCYKDPMFYGKEAILITGPNVDLAKDLIRRSKRFLYEREMLYTDKGEYGLEVNGATIKCYPSNNIHSARGKPKISLFFGDEAAFFKLRDDSIVRTVGERYIGKNNAFVIWVSTAGEEPAGFFYDIMLEREDDTVYQRFHYYVEDGLRKDPVTKTSIFNEQYIIDASEARSYGREFLGLWGKNVGDIFSEEALEQIFKEDYTLKPEDESYDRIIAIDPGYGSSEYGVLGMEKSDGKYTVLFAKTWERIGYMDAVSNVRKLCDEWSINRAMVDGSAPELIKDLRDKYRMDVTPLNFNEHGDRMLGFASSKVNRNEVRIQPSFRKLKNQLTTIRLNKKGLPDKTNHNPFDLGDAFLMALFYYKMGSGVIVGVY